MHKKQKIFILLTLAWMVIIYAYSAKTAEESTEESNRVGMWVGSLLIPGFEDKTPAEQMAFAEKIDHPVRKTAHATEYCILALLVAGCFAGEVPEKSVGGQERKRSLGERRMVLAWLIATVYAATDEFHQLFVPGRSGQIKDVCIDSAGALAGLLLLYLCKGIFKKCMANRNSEKK